MIHILSIRFPKILINTKKKPDYFDYKELLV